tara:strand:- start:981 stop:1451 length:471 start_codon:yes stop_codon:yes gene_type:complete
MICGTTCIIALVFLIANIYTILSCANDKKDKQNFLNVLSNEQKNTYEKIINERKTIYYIGYIFGILLAIFAIFIIKKVLKIRFNNMSLVCLVGSIVFVTNYLFYILYPKSDYMLLHLSDKRQITEWLKIYRKMQYKFHLGFVFGIIAVIVFCISLR